jgi:hypothetical protein
MMVRREHEADAVNGKMKFKGTVPTDKPNKF